MVSTSLKIVRFGGAALFISLNSSVQSQGRVRSRPPDRCTIACAALDGVTSTTIDGMTIFICTPLRITPAAAAERSEVQPQRFFAGARQTALVRSFIR